MQYFSVNNWERHQHYKNRNPPWIKLHNTLLHDYEFTCLQDASKLHLILIWMLASQSDNKIPADQKWLQNTLHISEKIDLKALSNAGFITIDSNMLAECEQVALPEEKRRGETEKILSEKEPSDDLFKIFWLAYPRKDGKKKALSSFNKMTKKNKLLANDDIKTRFSNTEKKYIPLPATYLNGERWFDEGGGAGGTGLVKLSDGKTWDSDLGVAY